MGINLATASDVIMLDQDWNPQIMLQAEARAHRIGQDKPVTVYKLCTQGTVEEQMMGRIQKKLYLSVKVTESMRDIHSQGALKAQKGSKGNSTEGAEDDAPQLNTNQLMSLVRRGAQALAHDEIDANEMMDWDWQTMLDKCKDKPADVHVAEQTRTGAVVKEEDEKQWLAQIEQVQSRIFQGKVHSKKDNLDAYGGIEQDRSREQRRIGKNTTVIIDGHIVSKESASCADWEAVPTMAGKDASLADVKREKKADILNQEVSQAPNKAWHLLTDSSLALSGLLERRRHYTLFRVPTQLSLHLSRQAIQSEVQRQDVFSLSSTPVCGLRAEYHECRRYDISLSLVRAGVLRRLP